MKTINLLTIFLLFVVSAYSQISVKDFDGNQYSSVTIHNRMVTNTNLQALHYSDGTPIVGYGHIDTTKNPCPVGWHILSIADFQLIFNTYPNAADLASTQVASGYTYGWKTTGGTNKSGFNALPNLDNCVYYLTSELTYANICQYDTTFTDYISYTSYYTNIAIRCMNNTNVVVTPKTAYVDVNYFCTGASGNITLTATGGSGDTLCWYSGSCGGTLVGKGTPLSIPKPTTTTTYFARWEAGTTYSACKSVTVTVTQTPAPIVSVADSCRKSILTITNPIANSFLWSDGGFGNPHTVGSSQKLTATQSQKVVPPFPFKMVTCISLPSKSVTTNPIYPAAPVITKIGNTLKSSSTTGNLWYMNDNLISSTSQIYSPNQAGYYYAVFQQNGCKSGFSNTIVFVPSGVGINDITKIELNIYPNPATDIINVEWNKENTTYQLVDISGKTVKSGQILMGKNIIIVTDLPQGLYFININDGNTSIQKKIVKIKFCRD